jgi:hypothetical protein
MGIIFRSKLLPDRSGAWGLLLPSKGDPWNEVSRADANGLVREINPAYLEFVQTERNSWRGIGWVMGVGGGLMLLLSMIPKFSIAPELVAKIGVVNAVLVTLIPLMTVFLLALVGYFAARAPLAPPVILSRKLRKFYQWQSKKIGWISIAYDHAVPYASMGAVVSQGGGYTYFRLHVAELEPISRRIIHSISVSEITRGPQASCSAWEFIRLYMDGPADILPGIPYRPSIEQSSAFNARLDRDILKDMVDEEHRLVSGFMNVLYFGYSGMVEYWFFRAMAWIERTAPRPAFPLELLEAMQWQGENPYKVTPPSLVEQLALNGRLPHLNRRWAVAKWLSTLLWGGAFVAMIYTFWFIY